MLLQIFFRTYTYNDRRYGHYQPNGYGQQYPGQKLPGQYPQGVPLGEDKFKFDPVNTKNNSYYPTIILNLQQFLEQPTKCTDAVSRYFGRMARRFTRKTSTRFTDS